MEIRLIFDFYHTEKKQNYGDQINIYLYHTEKKNILENNMTYKEIDYKF